MKKYYIIVAVIGLISLLMIIAGYSITGSPLEQKARVLDQERLSDFSTLSTSINIYYRDNGKLPISLSALNSTGSTLTDPGNNKNYDYTITGNDTYNLCTTFDTAGTPNAYSPYVYGGINRFQVGKSTHAKGYDCEEFQVPLNFKTPNGVPGQSSYVIPTPTGTIQQDFTNFISMGKLPVENNIILNVTQVIIQGNSINVTLAVTNTNQTAQSITSANFRLYNNTGQNESGTTTLPSQIPYSPTAAYYGITFNAMQNPPYTLKYINSSGSDVILATIR